MSSYETSFNGNISLQCENATYPDVRHLHVRHLEREVSRQHITQDDADKLLKSSDDMWKAAQKKPNVKLILDAKAKAKKQAEEDEKVTLKARLKELGDK